MATRFKELLPAKTLEAGNTTQYTAANCVAIISKATATNIGTANASFSVFVADGGVGLSNAVRIIYERQLAPKETYTCPELVGHALEDGSYIATSATEGAITFRVSGREVTV